MQHALGNISDIEEGKSKAYTLTVNHKTINLMVVRQSGKIYAYENHCPHTGISLNWQPDQFLDITEKYIQCSTHGALFRIDTGLCEWGPCLGQSLRPLTVHNKDGMLFLKITTALSSS